MKKIQVLSDPVPHSFTGSGLRVTEEAYVYILECRALSTLAHGGDLEDEDTMHHLTRYWGLDEEGVRARARSMRLWAGRKLTQEMVDNPPAHMADVVWHFVGELGFTNRPFEHAQDMAKDPHSQVRRDVGRLYLERNPT